VGVKACDLKGFKVQDFVFKDHDCTDPFYMKLRKENLIISADCTCAIETCFCLTLNVKPYPQEDFDINLSMAEGGFVVEVGSDKGKKYIEKFSSLFEKAGENLVKQRESNRKKVTEDVQKNIADNQVPHQDSLKGAVERNYESEIWSDEAKTCVECGACNTICPTCHCFLLYDQKDEKSMARLRIWDSCMIKDFARVAGGANPREKLWMRLRNRFEKKLDFFPKVASVYACTGCGRCISACPAKIDIRRVMKRLKGNE
ncbi:MAG: 4Fe-4S dicluster domain-containing protein, partial [Candidatus Aureabacteria bacterium]|nr:4Fe-4S dicluster domain-containing protein [Candidatus Auribacterota bacterium]